ncbi:TIGR02186 family protein [Acidihalobacter prosperus]
MKIKLLLIALAFLPSLVWAQGAPKPSHHLVTDLTRDRVNISVRYTGDEITLFGAMSQPAQVVIKVASPNQPISIKKKGRVGPFWLSVDKYDVSHSPGLYFLLSSKPINQLLAGSQRDRYGLSLNRAVSKIQTNPSPPNTRHLANALINLKKKNHQYVVDGHAVKILGERLFSTTIKLPAQLPLGVYHVDIYLVHHGKVVATEHRTIKVSQVHIEQWVSDVANNHSWIFGITFTLLVMAFGLILGIVMGRGSKKS